MKKTVEIYCIENLVNGKKYIGQSIESEKRIETHIYDLRANRDSSIYLQNSWNKYGEQNFRIYFIEK